MIGARLDAVSEIAESMKTYRTSYTSFLEVEGADVTISQPEIHHIISSVLSTLGRSPDIQRGITRIFHKKATASEVKGFIFFLLGQDFLSFILYATVSDLMGKIIKMQLFKGSLTYSTSSGNYRQEPVVGKY